jgi:hypothetical protein
MCHLVGYSLYSYFRVCSLGTFDPNDNSYYLQNPKPSIMRSKTRTHVAIALQLSARRAEHLLTTDKPGHFQLFAVRTVARPLLTLVTVRRAYRLVCSLACIRRVCFPLVYQHFGTARRGIRSYRYWNTEISQRGTTRLLLDGFSWNLIFEDFSKICRENSSFIKIGQKERETDVQTNMYFFIISRSFLLRMRNVSDKSCRENQNTYFVFSNFF